jgi:hypothetical protein
MARIRCIKPDFWNNEKVLECSPITRLMFIGMWNFADDTGRMRYAPKTIKAQIFPLDNIQISDVVRMLDELSSSGLIQIYTVEGADYLWITGWHHQKIDRPQKSKYPSPHENSSSIQRRVAPDLRGSKGSEPEKKDGAGAPIVTLFPSSAAPPSEEKSYFDRSKEILGPKGNGLAAKLLRVQGKVIAKARAVLETASTKSDPAAYVGAVIRGGDRDEMGAAMAPGYGDDWG